MYSFSGHTTVKADAKGRVFVPAHYRKQLPENGDSRFMMRVNTKRGFLDVYPESVWKEEIAQVESRLNMFDDDDYFFYMKYTSMVETLEVDSNGRVLIPKKIMDQVGITGEVVFLGVAKKLAIWGKERYEQNMMSDEEFNMLKKEKLGNK